MSEIMMQNLHSGFMMAIIGMGVVMAFLVLMMGFMNITEKVMVKLNEWFPEEVPTAPVAKKPSSNNDEIAIAIAAAMRKIGIK